MNDDNVLSQVATLANMFDVARMSLLILGIAAIAFTNAAVRRLGQALMQRFPSRRFLILQFATLISFTVYIGGSLVLVVGVLQPPREFLIAIGGSAAVAVGFALKDIAASIVSGLILLFDRPFQVGDRVSFDNVYGEIVSIGLRSVRLQTLDDNLVTIPNSRFINDITASANAGALDMMVVTDFHLALDVDINLARDLVRQVIVTSRFAYLKKPVTFSIEEVAVAERLAIRLRAKAYVLDVVYEKALQSDITLRSSELFRQYGLARPA
ncbi:MAG: mechanosensitive ion channel [Gammaproteobacteria bacterium]|jgi:small-conductance mechanosensitive channel|nr:mechanosensitive ion channel [Gammaproteobacteria bacterium]MBP6050633.1 mechanosensitive ion channel [Pseudomonadales bacterium]MBK6585448.1 mechanosensitive ion channel [Gammaproteobacteria bacterium]MBK7168905.1 mechanosensitive ion channel [Gammaproteobacteria bacterium]MBK7521056.1 mechanosensitive ion channel [Gammaproteobacteria bacterium]